MKLFERKGYVTIDGTEIHNLDFQFSVSKSLSPELDKGRFTIENLPETKRNVVASSSLGATLRELRYVQIEIFAGYEIPSKIFAGQIYRASSSYNSHTWSTSVEAGDGEGLRRIFANDSWKERMSVVDVIRSLVKIIGVRPGNLELAIASGVFASAPLVNLDNGYATSGQALEALNVLLLGNKLRWTIQDNEIKILAQNGTLPDPPVQIASMPSNTGLVGQPTRTDKGGLIFRSLLRADLLPGRLVTVTSKHVTFSGRIESVEHIGDTRGGPWHTVCEAANLANLAAYDVDPLLQ